MKILDLTNSNEQKQWIEKIRACDWRAAKFLADLLEQNKFHNVLGNGSLFIMVDGEKLVSFCTLTQRDCIKDDDMYPWVGFVYTAPDYRGKRYSGEVIEAACQRALGQDFDKVYLATDHVGLYEKYGFTYLESRTDIYGEESRIYYKELQ